MGTFLTNFLTNFLTVGKFSITSSKSVDNSSTRSSMHGKFFDRLFSGANFIHVEQLTAASWAFRQERADAEPLQDCYPRFTVPVYTMIANAFNSAEPLSRKRIQVLLNAWNNTYDLDPHLTESLEQAGLGVSFQRFYLELVHMDCSTIGTRCSCILSSGWLVLNSWWCLGLEDRADRASTADSAGGGAD